MTPIRDTTPRWRNSFAIFARTSDLSDAPGKVFHRVPTYRPVRQFSSHIDPSPAQHHVERFRNRDRPHGRARLADAQPHFTLTCVVLAHPGFERRLCAKDLDLS